MWNMQSGIKRKTFNVGQRPPEVAARLRSGEKERAVTGLATDSLNRLLVASTYDGTINVTTTSLLHLKQRLTCLSLSQVL